MGNLYLDTDKEFCSIIFDVFRDGGVTDVVCSPGSRNAPLLIAAAAREELRKHVITDERSAAFFGLGISQVNRKPVVLVCTSGTALLNYSPAVAEAYYQGLPMIVVSADRPEQWIDQDDSQTIRQQGVLNNIVKQSYEIISEGENNPEMKWYVNRIANDALLEATGGKPGPVHINVRLSEPLGRKREREYDETRIIRRVQADSIGNKEYLNNLAKELSHKKVMLVAGFLPPSSQLQKAVTTFSALSNVTVFAETLSNLHLKDFPSCIDTVLTALSTEELDELKPDIVISIGGSLVSRKLKEYLRRNKNKIEHWSLGYDRTTVDCFMSQTMRLEVDPSRFIRHISARLQRGEMSSEVKNFRNEWTEKKRQAIDIKEKYIDNTGWSSLKAFNHILKTLPASYNLFLSNGTTVRYAQLIDYRQPHASYCNRGVSGIEGCLSAATGGAVKYKGNTLLMTGDMSLGYDMSALGLKEIPDTMKIIMVDNGGGGIFRFIPSTRNLTEREEYFCANPDLPVKQLAEAFGWNYFEADSEESLKNQLKFFYSSARKSILKIKVDGEISAEILSNYMEVKITN